MCSLKHAHLLIVEREDPYRLRRPRWSSRRHNGIIEPPKKMIAGDKRSKGLNASWTAATFGPRAGVFFHVCGVTLSCIEMHVCKV